MTRTARRPSQARAAGERPAGAPFPATKGSPARWFPAPGALFDIREPFFAPVLLVFLTRVLAWANLPYPSEDAYITFRYARNLATGAGAVFNPGEPVMGFTSAPWMLWNAAGFALTHSLVMWSRASLLAADLVVVVLAAHLLVRHASRASAWTFGLFFALWPYFSALGASGMENGVLAALVLLSVSLAAARNPVAGPAIALLALWRPEGLVCAAIAAVAAGWRDRLVAALLTAAGLGALAATFGSALPQSMLAKSALYGTPGPWAGREWWEWVIPGPLGRWTPTGEGISLIPLGVLIAPALVLGLAELWRRRSTPLAVSAAALLAVWVGYASLGVAYFFWYFTTPAAAVALVASVGFPRLVRGRALPIAAIVSLLALWTIASSLYRGRAAAEYRTFARVGRFLAEKALPTESVMLEPIGSIGWLTPMRVIDEAGLVTPSVLQRRLQGPGWYSDVAAQKRPDWLVVRAGVLRSGQAFAGVGAPFRNTAERDSVFARYQLALGDAAGGEQELLVYHRQR